MTPTQSLVNKSTRYSSGALQERYFFLQGVGILIDDVVCLPDCASIVAPDLCVERQMLLFRPVITSRPFEPPVSFSVNDDTGTSGTSGNVVTSLP
jgi:hypothetical protein